MNRKRKVTFTLLELLLVIAIIAILSSMILPVLKNLRNKSKAIVCINNQKQVYLGIASYANDNQNYRPPISTGSGGVFWGRILIDDKYLPEVKSGSPTILLCPSATPNLVLDSFKNQMNRSYGMNRESPYSGPNTISEISVFAPYKIDKSKCISQDILISDSLSLESGLGQFEQWRFFYKTDSGTKYLLHFRHDSKVNASFYDGHISSFTAKSLSGLESFKYTATFSGIDKNMLQFNF